MKSELHFLVWRSDAAVAVVVAAAVVMLTTSTNAKYERIKTRSCGQAWTVFYDENMKT